MEFDRAELVEVLDKAGPLFNKTSLTPELGCLWFDGSFVYAFNGEVGIRQKLKTDLKCGIPGRMFIDLIKKTGLPKVSISENNDGALLKFGKTKIDLAVQPYDRRVWNFPDKPPKKNAAVVVLSKEVLGAIKKLDFITSSQPTRPEHEGISILPVKKALHLYATDNKTLGQVIINGAYAETVPHVIMPWGFTERLLALVVAGSELLVMNDYLVVESPGLQLFSSLKETPAEPDFPGTVARCVNGSGKLPELPGTLKLVLDRAQIMANGEEALLSLSFGPKGFIAEGRWRSGALVQTITLKDPPKTEVKGTFHADLIERGVSHCNQIGLVNSVILMVGDDGFKYIVAPKAPRG